jgi:hypothetical protein
MLMLGADFIATIDIAEIQGVVYPGRGGEWEGTAYISLIINGGRTASPHFAGGAL